MSIPLESLILVASCPDRKGITRAVSNFIYDLGASITQSDQFGEDESERFFMRYEFAGFDKSPSKLQSARDCFASIADEFQMQWQIHDGTVKPRVMLAVSKFGHCLNDLLFRWRNGDMPFEIVGVVSNHPDFQAKVEWYELPYYHLPVNNESRPQQEQEILQLMTDSRADLLVLARYMQILSNDMCRSLQGRAINIHHSFLPSFKGAKPYHQAHSRGVKLIGATAHYVTSDLDEGPIIEQDIQRVGHAHSSSQMVRLGSEIESQVLARAVRWHCEHRVLLNENKTVVFN